MPQSGRKKTGIQPNLNADRLRIRSDRAQNQPKHESPWLSDVFSSRFERLYLGVVDRYIQRMSNPANASVLQSEMRAKYLELKDLGYDPDEILGRRVAAVRGDEQSTMTTAALVIVVYYFDACDIFENAPEVSAC